MQRTYTPLKRVIAEPAMYGMHRRVLNFEKNASAKYLRQKLGKGNKLV